jgi:peptidoglycan/LPS O-acetylase OafA/YrhL
MTTIEQRDVGRDNNFNLLRIIAASAVLVSHAWPLALGQGAIEPLYAATGYKLGTTAVTVFFTVSGFFITKSFENRASLYDFVISRVARIYPAFIIVLILTVLILGPIFSKLSLAAYFSDLRTWTYLPRNFMLVRLQYELPGVFSANPFPGAINGSLWTLFKEVSCYALVVLAGATGFTRPRAFPTILAISVAATFLLPQSEGGDLLHAAGTLGLPFALGAAAYVYRRYVPVHWALALALALIAAVLKGAAAYPAMHAVALSYGALWIGFASIPGINAYNRLGDYSYGMYIYAFPVEQMLVASDLASSPIRLVVLSFPITLLFAILSWTWIEAPALAHRHRLAAYWRLRRLG